MPVGSDVHPPGIELQLTESVMSGRAEQETREAVTIMDVEMVKVNEQRAARRDDEVEE